MLQNLASLQIILPFNELLLEFFISKHIFRNTFTPSPMLIAKKSLQSFSIIQLSDTINVFKSLKNEQTAAKANTKRQRRKKKKLREGNVIEVFSKQFLSFLFSSHLMLSHKMLVSFTQN